MFCIAKSLFVMEYRTHYRSFGWRITAVLLPSKCKMYRTIISGHLEKVRKVEDVDFLRERLWFLWKLWSFPLQMGIALNTDGRFYARKTWAYYSVLKISLRYKIVTLAWDYYGSLKHQYIGIGKDYERGFRYFVPEMQNVLIQTDCKLRYDYISI